MQIIDVYTDGGCHGNPGPGAWAFVVRSDSSVVEMAGGESLTTNNRMELEAVIQALRTIAEESNRPRRVTVHTDSQYVKNGITTWIKTWLKNGWMTSAKKPVKNRDRWIRLHELATLVGPEWKWVKGHAGDELNERCDRLVQEEIGRIERARTR
ncbi:MAG: ribonuclease HI [Spirochaetota bacterium]